MQVFIFRRQSSCLASRWTLLYHLINTLPTSYVRVISTFGHCDICDCHLNFESAKLMGSAIIGARIDYCNNVLYDTTERNLNRLQKVRTRRLASCIRLPSRRACVNNSTGYRSDNGSRRPTSWWPLLSRRTTVEPHCIVTNSFETTRLSGHFDPVPLHCFTDHLCPPISPLWRSTTLHLMFRTVSGPPQDRRTLSVVLGVAKSMNFSPLHRTCRLAITRRQRFWFAWHSAQYTFK